jgi:translation initiation factor 1A
MPKNQKGGSNFKKRKKSNFTQNNRQLELKDGPEQDYAIVKKMLGDCRLLAVAQSDASEKLCHIRGGMRKRVWVKEGDIILIGLRSFEQDKCDVIHKYTDDDARVLRKMNLITHLSKDTNFRSGDDSDDDLFGAEDEVEAFKDNEEDIDLEDL